eukprot:scaffold846_cov252-Pinguiococcus_pyrenoidosus.AAC.23
MPRDDLGWPCGDHRGEVESEFTRRPPKPASWRRWSAGLCGKERALTEKRFKQVGRSACRARVSEHLPRGRAHEARDLASDRFFVSNSPPDAGSFQGCLHGLSQENVGTDPSRSSGSQHRLPGQQRLALCARTHQGFDACDKGKGENLGSNVPKPFVMLWPVRYSFGNATGLRSGR